ncbi:MAG TPA: hypothetical protein VMB03_27245 [Bryobacteraceae bacterium]|nr:hypothetical protein [Bryobacteraceae bacterium]
MQIRHFFRILAPLVGAASAAFAAMDTNALVVTASNAANNQLLVYNTAGKLVQTLSTQGQGGVSGNSGGIEVNGDLVAAVNYGSNNVTLFQRAGSGLHLVQVIPTVAKPVSVAFGNDHLYVLGATEVESHWMFGPFANTGADGSAKLLVADGSAAQVVVADGQLLITEKSNQVETVALASDGQIDGAATAVKNIPANVNTPFGSVARGNDIYVTIAHANEISLVRDGAVLTTAPSGTQMAPCWLTLEGPFLFSSNSPSMSISRYAVYGQKIVQDAAVAATLNGDPTDIAFAGGMIAVIDGNGPVTHLSMFSVDEDGNLTLLQPADTINGAANGVGIVRSADQF